MDGSDDSLDIVKSCVLYFDKVILVEPVHVHKIDPYDKVNNNTKMHLSMLFDKDLSEQVTVFKEEGIVEKEIYTGVGHRIERENITFNEFCKELVGVNIEELFSHIDILSARELRVTASTTLIDPVAIECFNNTITELEKESLKTHHGLDFDMSPQATQVYWLLHLYKLLLNGIFDDLYLGNNCLSNSEFLNRLICSMRFENNKMSGKIDTRKYTKTNIALNCLSILLPNLSQLSFEQILEVRLKAKDELLELRSYMDKISEEVYPIMNDTSELSEIEKKLQINIKTAVKQFENRLTNLKIGIGQKILNDLKNPLTYSPLITTLFGNIPIQAALAASVSLTSFDALLEYFKKKNEMQNDSLYFTLKLKRTMY